MAINVNTVYQTVLLILNKEQRGLLTPDEFNKIATQVQLDIFEQYFDDLNQQVRVKQTNIDYGDRVANIEEKMSIFQKHGNMSIDDGVWTLPNDAYYVNNISYNGIDVERVTRGQLLFLNKSTLTQPSENYPVYVQQGLEVEAFPDSIRSASSNDVVIYYIRKPQDPYWDYKEGEFGQYIFQDENTVGYKTKYFELSSAEQTRVILKVLKYAGVIVSDPEIVQAAASEVAQNETNQKS